MNLDANYKFQEIMNTKPYFSGERSVPISHGMVFMPCTKSVLPILANDLSPHDR
ncbi:hypothetical protein [Sideroxydans sp. CL21]|nr:hypothetical protein [Sideroxydans sp. CL21]